ncbi:glycosyltransferase [uncultured Selenomonas sp.]|uniref:glycosyltransferase n=1 Tax=uncultured Selenomonas sp. TaxID=159275 RepID=UPI0025EB106D|nr:glycosyltransferase [uncultured Selenomonas sp.]
MNLPLRKAWATLRNDGLRAFVQKTRAFLQRARHQAQAVRRPAYVDVLFINGCPLPHPYRYRVQHQRDQLLAAGLCNEERWVDDVSAEDLALCRAVIIYRAPWTPALEALVQQAHDWQKPVFFDIDDLVIDTRYTDTIPYVQQMTPEEKAVYDDGVHRYGRMMQLCDGAITTTEALAAELGRYMGDVFINRNTASGLMVSLSEKALAARKERWAAAGEGKQPVVLGYFSGSITHNDDYAMILPALVTVLDTCQEVRLLVVGELDLPDALAPYRDRVTARPFVDWQQIPALIAEADINLVPLLPTVFDAAKSENKWTEAALVGVPTVASDIGAFHHCIEDGRTGLLCKAPDDWAPAICRLVRDAALRDRLGEAARQEALAHHLTENTGRPLADWLRRHMRPSLAMLVPSFDTSGGILVALRHCDILRRHGCDVTAVNLDDRPTAERTTAVATVPTLLAKDVDFCAAFDKGVATMWITVGPFLREHAREHYYLVQNKEHGFYPYGAPQRLLASATYRQPDLVYCTISRWCEAWLRDEYGTPSRYAPNGLDRAAYAPAPRDWTGRITILIEGDSASEYKNVDEAFRIVDLLPKDRYAIWYVSYNGGRKPWYRVDRFLHRVPHGEMPDLYRQCHILLKTSILESFSYPPLEMIATGGCAVVRENDGNREYLVDGGNCLFYDPADLRTAVTAIERITNDPVLREHLQQGGAAVADERDWTHCEAAVCALYDAAE